MSNMSKLTRTFAFLALIALSLSACAPPRTPADSTPTASQSPSTTPTATITPSPTPRPPITVRFYRLRLVYSTTSDWSSLELLDPDGVLSVRTMEVHGEPENYYVSPGTLGLNQPLADAGKTVGVTVDFALKPEALDEPLHFLLTKGSVYGSRVEFFDMINDEPVLIKTITHNGAVQSNPGTNPLRFSIDLSALQASPPEVAEIQPASQEKLVWAFYYPWYKLSDWNSSILPDQPEVRYASSDVEAISRQVDEAQAAGIDGFISSWWGPHDPTDDNLKMLLEIAEEKGMSSYPMIDTSSGTDRFRSSSACFAPKAMMSLDAKTAVKCVPESRSPLIFSYAAFQSCPPCTISFSRRETPSSSSAVLKPL